MSAFLHHEHDAAHATEGHCWLCGGPVELAESTACVCGPYGVIVPTVLPPAMAQQLAYNGTALSSWMVPDEHGHHPKPGSPPPPPPPQEPEPGKAVRHA